MHAAKNTQRITNLYFKAEGHEDFRQYQGALPHGLDFSMNADAVKACFPSPPNFSSPKHNAWDFADYRLIALYAKDTGKIITVSLTSKM